MHSHLNFKYTNKKIHDYITDTDGKPGSNILHLKQEHEKLNKSKYYNK